MEYVLLPVSGLHFRSNVNYLKLQVNFDSPNGIIGGMEKYTIMQKIDKNNPKAAEETAVNNVRNQNSTDLVIDQDLKLPISNGFITLKWWLLLETLLN